MSDLRRLVVVDDHRLLHPVFEAILASEGFEVAAFARRGSELLPLVYRHSPDAVILELDLPELDGIATIQRLTTRFPKVPAIVLAASASRENISAALAAGARAYISKAVELDSLGETMRRAIDGELEQTVVTAAPHRVTSILTERELEVLELLAEGIPNKEIAARLHRTEQTVKFHLTSIYRKLGVKNRTGAVSAGIGAGITAWAS
jgi:DNA-binding NarL/FixJ family response regulator